MAIDSPTIALLRDRLRRLRDPDTGVRFMMELIEPGFSYLEHFTSIETIDTEIERLREVRADLVDAQRKRDIEIKLIEGMIGS